MRLIDIIWKEISLIKSQKIALLLIFIYPFIAIGLLGSSFAGITAPDHISVGIVNELSFDSNMLGKIGVIKELSILNFDDVNSMVSAVKRKEIMVGMKLSSESPYSKMRIDLYYDNSNLLASQFFLQIAQAMIRNITVSAAQEKMSSIWETISSLGASINSEVANVREFQKKLDSSGEALQKLEDDLAAIDFTEIEGVLNQQKGAISGMQSDSAQFKKDFAEFKASFITMKSDILALKPTLTSYKSSIESTASQLSASISSIDSIIASLESVKASSPVVIGAAISELQKNRAQLVSYRNSLTQAIASISQVESNFAKIEDSIKKADALFAKVDATMGGLDSQMSSSSTAISTVSAKLQLFKDSIDEVKNLITEAKKSKAEISAKLAESEQLLSSFSIKLSDFKKIDPSTLVQPAVFFENRVYDVDPFGILASNVLVIVLIMTCMLLTSILIILERTQNVSLRMRLSPTSKAYLLAGKIVGQLIIAMIEAGIIFGVAFAKIPLPFPIFGISFLGFGLHSIVSLPELFAAVVLISLAFISFGMLIAFFAKSQSTAILASLLIIVPMLFLSGAILPIEFMKPFMQLVSRAMPLTAANNLLISLVVKGAPIMDSAVEIAILAGLILLVFCLVAVKKEY
ncbi:MAG: ABC transporter permease [Candidatus Diapherotrites archaeon]|nr:ABC transporter permease [Candidatus Diapherotrites archaeon]